MKMKDVQGANLNDNKNKAVIGSFKEPIAYQLRYGETRIIIITKFGGSGLVAGFHCHAAKKVNPKLLSPKKKSRILQVVENYQMFCLSKSRVCTRAQYGNVILVPMQRGTNMAAGNQ